MQQYFGDNFDINEDPIRQSYKNNQSEFTMDNNPLLPQQPSENPLLPKENLNNTLNNVFLTEITKPKSNDFSIIPKLNKTDDINTYNNEMNRFNNLSQEILEKEKQLMESKSEIIKLKNEIETLNEENKKITILEYQNSELNNRLNSLLKEQQLASDTKETNTLLKKELDRYKNENNKLKVLLDNSSINIYDEEETIPPPPKKVKRPIKKKKIKNPNKSPEINKLKKLLLSHYPSYTEDKINIMFSELDINDNITITRDLLEAITGYMEIE